MKLKIKISTILFIILLSVSAFAQEDTYIVRFNDSISLFSAREEKGIDFAVATEEELQEYIDAGIVEHYEPNYEVCAIEPVAEETDEGASDIVENWNFDRVKAQFAYNIGSMGNDVKIAVIDSGLYSDDMIRAQILPGYDYINNEDTYETVENDKTYHGTIVSSIIARQNNGYGTGIAPRAYIVPLRVLNDKNSGNVANIIRAVKDATYKYKCDVINLSLVLSDSEVTQENLTILQEAINDAADEGIIIIAASGNKGNNSYAYPASLDNVISVASVDCDGARSDFSQYNDKVFVSAPGGIMNVAIKYRLDENGEGIVTLYTVSGTSFAAPHVSALAAIAKCIKPEINTAQFKELLKSTSGKANRDDELGYGVINCESAINKLIENWKIYISPITIKDVDEANYKGTVSEAIVYNNTGNPIDFTMIYGLYNPDRTLGNVTAKSALSLPSGATGRWRVQYSGGNVIYMVWDSLTSMVPLGPSSYR